MFIVSVKVGEIKRVAATAADAGENTPAYVKPGTLGNPGTQWSPITPGIAGVVPVPATEGAQADITGQTIGSTVVDVHGLDANEAPFSSQLQVNVVIGLATHYIFSVLS